MGQISATTRKACRKFNLSIYIRLSGIAPAKVLCLELKQGTPTHNQRRKNFNTLRGFTMAIPSNLQVALPQNSEITFTLTLSGTVLIKPIPQVTVPTNTDEQDFFLTSDDDFGHYPEPELCDHCDALAVRDGLCAYHYDMDHDLETPD